MGDNANPCRPLRLLALDADDLQIMSGALQDALCLAGDIRYEPKARRLTIMFNRYRWESVGGPCGERVFAALQFGDVVRVRQRGLTHDDPAQLLSCLAVQFEASEAPGGVVHLRFGHGGDLAIEVECVDAALADVTDAWPAARAPDHDATDHDTAGQAAPGHEAGGSGEPAGAMEPAAADA